MSLRVIVPPGPVLTPADIPGSHAADDAQIAAMIAAVTAEIDGPDGWLGRAIGPQTLELSGWFGCSRIWLPCPPVIEIVSLVTEDGNGVSETADPSTYRHDGNEVLLAPGAAWVSRPVHRVRYRAGYDGQTVETGGTGAVPAQIKQAIVMSVQHMNALGAENLFLRSEEVEGVGTFTYTVTDQASKIIQNAVERLLQGLRVYA